jgi:20S proteasome subunit beta 4
MHLHEYRTGKKLSMVASSSWIRRELADSLRSRKPYRVNLLLGGVDDKGEASLYYLDYLASCNKVEYGAQGYCGCAIHWFVKCCANLSPFSQVYGACCA